MKEIYYLAQGGTLITVRLVDSSNTRNLSLCNFSPISSPLAFLSLKTSTNGSNGFSLLVEQCPPTLANAPRMILVGPAEVPVASLSLSPGLERKECSQLPGLWFCWQLCYQEEAVWRQSTYPRKFWIVESGNLVSLSPNCRLLPIVKTRRALL